MLEWKAPGLQVCFDEEKRNICSLKTGEKECICKDAELPLFCIQFRDDEGEIIKADAIDACSVECVNIEGGVRIYYQGFQTGDFTVIVTVQADSQIKWRIGIENHSELTPEWVDFPQFAVLNNLKGNGGDYRILWGFNEGTLVEDMKAREEGGWIPYSDPVYPGEGTMGVFPAIVETQFMAYYGGQNGLYIGTHDSNGNLKGIDFCPVGSGIKLQYRLFTSALIHGSFEMDYDYVMEFFEGDWHDAAEIYRGWFEKNKKEEFLKIPENPNLPEWYGESPVVITYPVRGEKDTGDMTPNKLFPYKNAMPEIERLAKKMNSKILVLLMHWEGSAPWAPPYVWPPFGGEDVLKEFIEELHKKGHLLGVYCSGIGWTEQSNLVESYNKKEEFDREELWTEMCTSPKGELLYSHICTAQRRGYDFCPSRPFTVDTIAGEVTHMTEAGIDYIQVLDQNHGGTPYFCYSKEHGHPSVPGKWQTEAMTALLKRVESIGAKRKVLFGCESAAAETYLPYLLFSDNRFELAWAIGAKPVPAYAYVYHTYVNNFMGNQVCADGIFDHAQNPDNLLLRLAYSFTAGDMLTLVIDQDGNICQNWGAWEDKIIPDQEAVLTFVKNANAHRMGYGKKYLHLGQMRKPLSLKMPEPIRMKLKCGPVMEFEQLMTSAWRTEQEENGQFIVNYGKKSVSFDVCTDRKLLANGKKKTIEPVNGKVHLTIEPLEIILIEWEES